MRRSGCYAVAISSIGNKAMSDDKKEPWLNYMAFTTVFFALFATLSTFKGGGFSTLAVISQAKASDQWSYYQAKNIKGTMYELQKDSLQLAYDTLPANAAAPVKQHYLDLIAKADASIKKYNKEKADLSAQATDLEHQRDEAKKHGAPLGLAVILLQIAIVISSIAGLMKRKVLWQIALPLGLAGIAYFVDGLFLLF
jgi:hypothetical protein